MFKDIYPAFSV